MSENLTYRSKKIQGLEAVVVGVLVVIFFLLPQSHLSYSTRILNLGDEGLLWYVSQRTELGDVPLRDSFSYDPGRYYWSASIFKLLRADGLFEQIIADDLFGLIGLVIIYFAMCRVGLRRGWRLTICFLLGVCLGFPRHKIFEQSLSLIAVAGITFVLAKPTSKRWLWYGVATGLAAFIGRNSGVYFVLAAFLAWVILRYLRVTFNTFRAIGAYISGVAIGYLPMFAMLLGIRGFPAALWQSILLNSKQLIPVPVPFPWRLQALGMHGIQPVAVSILFIVVPVAYLSVLVLLPRVKNGISGIDERTLAYGASIAGLPYLIHGFSYATFGHLSQACLPFVVATASVAAYFYKNGKIGLPLSLMACVAGLVLVSWIPREPAVEYFRKRDHYKSIEIQGTRFKMLREDVDLLLASKEAFERCGGRDGSFLSSPTYPTPYAFLRTRSPFWEVYFILLRLPRNEESQTRHIEALQQNHTSVIELDPGEEGGMKILYPRLYDYIHANYVPMNPRFPIGEVKMYYQSQLCR